MPCLCEQCVATGTNFIAACSSISATLGALFPLTLDSCLSTLIVGRTSPGYGKNLTLTLIAGSRSVVYTGAVFGYSSPSITSVVRGSSSFPCASSLGTCVTQACSVRAHLAVLTTPTVTAVPVIIGLLVVLLGIVSAVQSGDLLLPTVGVFPSGRVAIVTLTGFNFGPVSSPLSVTFSNADGIVRTATNCTRDAVSHRWVSCVPGAGVGTTHVWTVTVGGQRSMPSLTATSYAPPELIAVSGSGGSNANTDGGQIVLLSGREFGPVSANAIVSNDALVHVHYGPVVRAIEGRDFVGDLFTHSHTSKSKSKDRYSVLPPILTLLCVLRCSFACVRVCMCMCVHPRSGIQLDT